MDRLQGIQRTQNALRQEISSKEGEVHVLKGERDVVQAQCKSVGDKKAELEAFLEEKMALILDLQRENAMLTARFDADMNEMRRTLDARTSESATLSRTLGTLSDQVAMKEADIARLSAEVKALRGRDAEAIKLAEAERHLMARLADTEAKLATFESEAAHLASERDALRRNAETRARGYAAKEAATLAKERALVDHAALLSRAVHARTADAHRAEVAASRALASYHALRTDIAAADRAACSEARRREILLRP